MRLEEQKLAGHFKFCENDYRYPVKRDIHYGNNEDGFRGELTIKEDGSLFLELEGLGYGRLRSILRRRKILKFSRIDGETSHGRSYIILLDCCFGNSLGGRALKLYPKICLIQRASHGEQGVGWYIFESNDPVEFDKIRFCLDGVKGFALPDLQGVKKTTPVYDKVESHQHGYAKKLNIEWNEPEPLEFKTKHFTFKIELKAWEWSETIEPRAYCVLEFSKPLPAKDCIKKVEAIKYFFGFLFDKRTGITNIYGYLTGHERELLVDDAYNEKGERIAGDVINYPVYWNLYYEGDEWEQEYNDYPHTRYKNFSKDGENLLGKYLESFVGKYEKDYYFYLFFEKYIYRLFPAVEVDRFKSVADDCEYLFSKYYDSLLNDKKPKWKKQSFKQWRQIKLLAKPLVGCMFDSLDECEDFGKEVAKYRNANGVTHFDEKKDRIDFSNLNKLSRKLIIIAKFHFLNLLYEDSDLNCDLIRECKHYWIGPDRA